MNSPRRAVFSLLMAFGFAVQTFAATAPAVATGRETARVSRAIVDWAPGLDNPRNSEGAFLDLKDGTILFAYSHFVGTSFADAAKARLVTRRSSDGGETWSGETFIVTPEEESVMNVMSVSLLRFQNGEIGLFYLLRRSWHDLRMYVRRSADEGATWGEPICCMPVPGYYVVNNDRVLRLSSGRIIIPTAWHRARTERNETAANDWRGVAMFFVSDNDGRTWREASGICTLPVVHTKSGLQEPGVVELPGGLIWGWARTDLGRQYEFFSRDNGETWTLPAPSRFTSPNSPLSMKRVPGTDRVVAIWNPGAGYETRPLSRIGGDRTPLVLATGTNSIGAWSRATVLEGNDGVDAGYCYTAIHFTKDAVLLAYCAGGEADHNRLARLRLRKIPLTTLP